MISKTVIRILLFLILCLSSTISRADEDEAANAPVQEINAWIYWYNLELDRLSSLGESENYIIGKIQKRHGQFPFRILKSAVNNDGEKGSAVKEVVKELISWLVSGTDFEPFVFGRLEKLTGERFSSSNQWIDWYKKRSDKLQWSPAADRLVSN